MTFETRFRKANKEIRKSSVDTYLRNIKRIAKLAGLDKIPDHPRWLTKGVLSKIKKDKLNTRKILSAAAVKVFRVYDKEPGQWSSLMKKSTDEYNRLREDRKKTTREKALWPEGGFPSVWKAAQKMGRGVDMAPTTLRGLRKLQDVWLLSFYATHTPRLIETVMLSSKSPNRLVRKGKGWEMVLEQHKTSGSMGTSRIKLDKRLNVLTTSFVASLKRMSKPFLLVNARGGQLSKSGLSKRLVVITRDAGLKAGFSAQILRVLKSTANRDTIMKAQKLESEMGHGKRESRRYAKKD